MKKIKLFGLLLTFSLCFSYGQEQSDYCDLKLDVALGYLTQGIPLPTKYRQNVKTLVEDCIDDPSPKSRLVKGIFQWKDYLPNSSKKEAFENVKLSAILGNDTAGFILGIFYKDGIGTEQNFQLAWDWFKASADLGNGNAEYAVGYFYLKGIVVEQSYDKAVEWFSKSNFVMAKHYLGICHFFGYGVPKNETYGLELLDENNISNSIELARSLSAGENIYIPDTTVVPDLGYHEELPVSIPTSDRLYTEYEGKLIEYDWAGREIKRTTPVELKLTNLPEDGSIEYYFSFVSRQRKGTVANLESILIFGGLTLDDEKLYPDNPEKPILRHRIPFADFKLIEKDGQEYLVATVTSEVLEWNKEPGAPRLLVLKKTDTAQPLLTSDLVENDFITVFPNPFAENFTFSFGVNGQFNGTAVLLDNSGNILEHIFSEEYLSTGEHNFQVDASSYPQGIYYIRLELANDEGEDLYTKRILKN